MKRSAMSVGSCAIALGLAVSGPVSAIEVQKIFLQNAPAICGAVDPADDIYLRRYPPSLYNAKPESVQVICQMPTVDGGSSGSGANSGGLYFKNNTGASGTVSCTGSAGSTFFGVTNKFKSKVFAAGAYSFISWTEGTDYPVDTDNLNFSCTLPKGFAVHDLYFYYDTEVGA